MSRQKVGELYAELGIEDLTEKQLKAAEESMTRAARRMDRIDDPTLGLDDAVFQGQLREAHRHLERLDADRANPELALDNHGFDESVDRVRAQLRDLDDEQVVLPEVDSSQLGGASAASGVSGAIAGLTTVAVAAAATIGIEAGKALADNFMDWADRGLEEDRLGAALGLSAAESERLGEIAGKVYADAWGGSVNDSTAAIELAKTNGLIDLSDTDAEIQRVTEQLVAMSTIFGQDSEQIARAASQLIRNGVAKDTQEAFDLITTGFQKGGNASGDFLDTMAQYSAMFRALGVEGPQALGMVDQLLSAGSWSADLAADAIKEFTIRTKDGSDLTRQGLRDLGLDAEDTAAKLAAGGPGAAAAFDQILDRIRNIEDPLKRSRTQAALFGTQSEDLQSALDALDPSAAADGFEDYAGRTKRAVDQAGDNVASSIESTQRDVKMGFENWLGGLWTSFDEGGLDGLTENLSGQIENFGTWWDENGGHITDAARDWWEASGQELLGDVLTEAMEVAWDVAWASFQEYVEDPGNWPIVGGFVQAGEAIVEELDNFLGDAFDLLTDIDWAEGWKSFGDAFIDVLNFVIDGWNDFEIKLPSFDGLEIGGQTVIPGWEGPTLGTPNLDHLPHFARGGDVLGPKGSAILAVLHGGEHVQTADQKDSEDAYTRRLEAALARPWPKPSGGNTIMYYTFNPERYIGNSPWLKTG